MSVSRATSKRVNGFTLDQARGFCAALASVKALLLTRLAWGRGQPASRRKRQRGAGRCSLLGACGVLSRGIVARICKHGALARLLAASHWPVFRVCRSRGKLRETGAY